MILKTAVQKYGQFENVMVSLYDKTDWFRETIRTWISDAMAMNLVMMWALLLAENTVVSVDTYTIENNWLLYVGSALMLYWVVSAPFVAGAMTIYGKHTYKIWTMFLVFSPVYIAGIAPNSQLINSIQPIEMFSGYTYALGITGAGFLACLMMRVIFGGLLWTVKRT